MSSYLNFLSKKHAYYKIPLVVVTGVGRSGTTALRRSLGKHKNIHYTNSENNIFYDILQVAYRNCTIESRRVAMQVKEEKYNEIFKSSILDLLFPKVKKREPDYIMVFSNLSAQTMRYARTLFNQIKVIFIVRNGIDVVSSRMRYSGFNQNPFEDHLEKWNDGARFFMDSRKEDYTFGIRHEILSDAELVEKEFKKLYDFLDIKYDSKPIENITSKRYHPTKKNSMVSGMNWSKYQKEQFKEICGESMAELNYSIPF